MHYNVTSQSTHSSYRNVVIKRKQKSSANMSTKIREPVASHTISTTKQK